MPLRYPVASSVPPGPNATAVARLGGPTRRTGSGGIGASPAKLHTITSGPSVDASSWLSPLQLSGRGFSGVPGSTVSLPCGNRQKWTLLSWHPDATTAPSGLQARLSIDPFPCR